MTEDMTPTRHDVESPDEPRRTRRGRSASRRGEAEVTVAHLAANGIEAFIVDQVEGGVIPMEGEWGVAVVVKAVDAELAREVLAADDDAEAATEGDLESDATDQRSREGTNRSLAGDAPVIASAARITAAAVYDVVSSAGNTISSG